MDQLESDPKVPKSRNNAHGNGQWKERLEESLMKGYPKQQIEAKMHSQIAHFAEAIFEIYNSSPAQSRK